MTRNTWKLIGLVALLFVVANSLFVVGQTEQVLVLEFGKPVKLVSKPGLDLKVPFVQNLIRYDKRLLEFNAEPMVAILRDKDRLVVDAFVRYRITDSLKFYQTVRSEDKMELRLARILEDALRKVLGREDLDTLLSPKRSQIMKSIRDLVYIEATGKLPRGGVHPVAVALAKAQPEAVRDDGFGIEIVDVRIMRSDLPKETSQAIFERMRSEREKVAEKFRAEGQKEAQKIRSRADKNRTILISDAQKQSQELRGTGEAESTKIYAEAFGQDPEFFDFYRSLEAYRNVMKKEDTTLLLSPSSPFLKYLQP